MPSTPKAIISSKNRRTRDGLASSNKVVFVVTRNPLWRAERIALTAISYTPSRQTAWSWSSWRPSMWMLNVKYFEGEYSGIFRSRRIALVHKYTYFFRSINPLTICGISGWISGSPPGILTIGAPHSSAANQHCSGVNRRSKTWAGYWIFPQPAHSRLHRNSGSSISTRG